MPEIILKTDMPDKATKFLVEALEIETLRLKYSMNLAKRWLSKFERKYSVTSKEFIKEWSAEDLEGKDLEYVEWAGEYNLSMRLNEHLDKMFNKTSLSAKKLSIAFLILGFLAFSPCISLSQEELPTKIESFMQIPKIIAPQMVLKDFIDGKSKTHVIVNLRKPSAFSQTQNMKNMKVRQDLEKSINTAQERVINTLDPSQVHITNKFRYIFGFSAEVSLKGLQGLIDNPDVLSIENDEILHANLAQGIPLMNASTPRSSYNGSGLSVAICDTGIDYTHSKLGGGGFPNTKVIGGYDTGENKSDPMDGNGHGTACAGIVAGDLGTVGDYIGGVAYNAKLYAVKITYTASGGSARTSDMIEGWEWCITHQNDDPNNPIMVISTSFGGGRHYSSCDSYSTAMTTAATNAVSTGITIFCSSGNDGYCDSMGWPACISHVISVGAVYDAAFTASSIGWCVSSGSCATKYPTGECSTGWYSPQVPNSDSVIVYSNTASFLSLLAPSNWPPPQKEEAVITPPLGALGALQPPAHMPPGRRPVFRVPTRPSTALF